MKINSRVFKVTSSDLERTFTFFAVTYFYENFLNPRQTADPSSTAFQWKQAPP
jgi:hypothetical protein